MTEEALQVWADAHDWEALFSVHIRFKRTYEYRWVRGHIVHPLPLKETESRQNIIAAGRAFLALKGS